MARVAYDHQIFGWQRFGGVSRYFVELARHIALNEDHEFSCKVVSPFYVNNYLFEARSPLGVAGIPSPAVRYTGRLYRFANRILSPFFLNRWRPNILHETYYSKTTVAPPGCRIVLTVFDMIHELHPECFPPWDPTRDEKRAAVARADHIVCISENTRQDLIRILGVPERKTTVIYLGFDMSHAEPAALPVAARPIILFVGSRANYKNFDRLLQAYAHRPALHCAYDIVAFGGGGFSSLERARIAALGLSVSQVRQQNGNDSVLRALYLQSTLFVYPSLYEGFGIPPLEAMSMGCPVACSNAGSIPEVVGEAAVYFDPSSSESIADTIEELATNQRLQETLRQRGRVRLELFSWQRCARQTLNVYQKVLQ